MSKKWSSEFKYPKKVIEKKVQSGYAAGRGVGSGIVDILLGGPSMFDSC